jgi:Trpc4-associated protein
MGMFLMNERNNILLRLMDVTTIQTINHENICCVNTTLTILLMQHRRGLLAKTLAEVRQLADERVESAARAKAYSGEDDQEAGAEEEEGAGAGLYCSPCVSSSSGGQQIMHNFRSLLFFWREYYLRRGRDRLSIEFNTRIPFKYWLELTNLLCADNGAPTSLLSAPCDLIRSPYATSAGGPKPFDP